MACSKCLEDLIDGRTAEKATLEVHVCRVPLDATDQESTSFMPINVVVYTSNLFLLVHVQMPMCLPKRQPDVNSSHAHASSPTDSIQAGDPV